MAGEENTEVQGSANAVSAGAETTPNTENQQPAWHAEAITWAKENGREVADINELLTPIEREVEKEVIKEVNPWEGVIDERDTAYLTYKKETGRGWDDYQKLQTNIDAIPNIDLAREQVRKEVSGVNLTDAQVDEYLEEQLGIDLSDSESTKTTIQLAKYTKQIREDKKAEQEKYRAPEPKNKPTEQQFNPDNYVQRPDGSVMRKEEYTAWEESQKNIIKSATEAVGQLKTQTFSIDIDENGETKQLPFTYEFSDDEVQNLTSHVESMITGKGMDKYRDGEQFNYGALVKDLVLNPTIMGNMIPSLLQKARAQAIEEVMKQNGNHNFNAQLPQHQQKREGVTIKPLNEIIGGARRF